MKEEDLRRRRKVDEVSDAINSKETRNEFELIADGQIIEEKLIPTGSTLLNLGLSDNPYGGFYQGTIVNTIGDSAAGKTFLALSTFAEMTYNDRFDKHELIYDEPERSLEFNLTHLFGEQVLSRVIQDITSESVEDFHDKVLAKAKGNVPFAYILDSLDAICPEDEIERDVRKGTYGANKPKLISEILRKIVQGVKDSNSFVNIISQTRDNLGVTFGSKKTRSGGKALKFFASHEIWLAVKGHIKRKERDVGVDVRVRIGKNKLTGKLREVEFPIYNDYGIDDTVSMIRFLVSDGKWTRAKGGIIDCKREFKAGYNEEELARYIESEKQKPKLIEMVTNLWREIENSIRTDRPRKYE